MHVITGLANTQEVVEQASNVPIGTIIAWVILICSITAVIISALNKLYDAFSKYQDLKEEEETVKIKIDEHDVKLNQICNQLNFIIKDIEERKNSDLKKLRHSLVRSGEECIEKGFISIRNLKSLEELYEEYCVKYSGNGYVKTLMEKIRQLPVVGELNENDENTIEYHEII